MDNSLIAFPGGPGLVGVYPGNKDQFIFYLLAYFGKPGHIIADCLLIICRAGADDYQELIALSGDDITDFLVPFFFYGSQPGRKGV